MNIQLTTLVTKIELFVFWTVAYGSLTTQPRNTAALSSTRVQLNCSTNITDPYQNVYVPVQWEFMYLNSSKLRVTDVAGTIRSTSVSYYVVTDGTYTGQFNLVIKSVGMNTAGRYTCLDNNGIGMTASTELIILGERNLK